MMKGLDLNLPIDDSLSENSPSTDLCLELPTLENNSKKPSGARPYNRSKMPRLRWSYKLHCSFLDAVGRLGGLERATPKMILEIMDVKGLTLSHIKSHLQLCRNGKTDPPMQDEAEAANANGIKKNIMASPDQMNGTLLPCYYNFSCKSAFDGHPNSTLTTNYLGQIAPTLNIFPPAPWKPVPEKMMMLDGRSNPSGKMFRDFFNGSTSIQGGDGNKMFGANGRSFSTKNTSSTIIKEDLPVSLELSLSSPISLKLTLN